MMTVKLMIDADCRRWWFDEGNDDDDDGVGDVVDNGDMIYDNVGDDNYVFVWW